MTTPDSELIARIPQDILDKIDRYALTVAEDTSDEAMVETRAIVVARLKAWVNATLEQRNREIADLKAQLALAGEATQAMAVVDALNRADWIKIPSAAGALGPAPDFGIHISFKGHGECTVYGATLVEAASKAAEKFSQWAMRDAAMKERT